MSQLSRSVSAVIAPEARPSSNRRRLYLVRFVFAIVWAGLFASTASTLGPAAITLLVLYPAFDAAAAIYDARSSVRADGPAVGLYVNIAVSALAAIGLAVAGADDIPAVLRVWGVWAIVAGLIQLIVGVLRRGSGGQWAMIFSGGLSVIVGFTFIASASGATSMKNLAGYAALGGVFFLVSALRSSRSDRVGGTERSFQ